VQKRRAVRIAKTALVPIVAMDAMTAHADARKAKVPKAVASALNIKPNENANAAGLFRLHLTQVNSDLSQLYILIKKAMYHSCNNRVTIM